MIIHSNWQTGELNSRQTSAIEVCSRQVISSQSAWRRSRTCWALTATCSCAARNALRLLWPQSDGGELKAGGRGLQLLGGASGGSSAVPPPSLKEFHKIKLSNWLGGETGVCHHVGGKGGREEGSSVLTRIKAEASDDLCVISEITLQLFSGDSSWCYVLNVAGWSEAKT